MSETQPEHPRPLAFVVDDDPLAAGVLCGMLGDAGYEGRAFSRGADAIEALRHTHPEVMLLDLVMPEMSGIEVLRRVRGTAPDVAVVMVSGFGTIKAAVDTLKLGASDFLEKPVEQPQLEAALARAVRYAHLCRQVNGLRAEQAERFRMVGSSKALGHVRDLITRAAPSSASVLITGESGVGKELVARALHINSARHAESFVALNCAAIPKELIESELFGYERGAFTGAESSHTGKLQEAHRGTLLLDEVADMSLAAQAKLLRFLENPEVERLGSNQVIRFDVRVLAATNRDLAVGIENGSFREDLYHRLNVVNIRVPALRERPEDVEELTAFFLERFCRQNNRALTFAPECIPVLQSYDWPGNVRELRNLVERIVVLARTDPVEPDELQSFLGVEVSARSDGALKAALDRVEREAVEKALAVSGGSVIAAARALGVGRSSLYRMMKRHGIPTDSAE